MGRIVHRKVGLFLRWCLLGFVEFRLYLQPEGLLLMARIGFRIFDRDGPSESGLWLCVFSRLASWLFGGPKLGPKALNPNAMLQGFTALRAYFPFHLNKYIKTRLSIVLLDVEIHTRLGLRHCHGYSPIICFLGDVFRSGDKVQLGPHTPEGARRAGVLGCMLADLGCRFEW